MPSAGKTGTTDEYTDAWFVGYNTKLSTAVWSGYPDARTTMGSGAFGGTYSAPTWHTFMEQATPVCDDFPVPSRLPSLTTFYSDHTVSPQSKTYGQTEATTTTSTDSTSTTDDSQQGPNDAYAPGIQPPSGGGDNGGGPPGGGGNGPSGGGVGPGG